MLLSHTKRGAPAGDLAGVYSRLAPNYDRLHRRWLRHAGGEAQAALEATVRAVTTPGMTLLDAGCGTGAFARRLLAEGLPPLHMTLLDPSEAMLSRCVDLPATLVAGRLERLPFFDAQFDMVTCAWALETVPNTHAALAELCRVVRPGGVLCLAFCSDKPTLGPSQWLMRWALLWRGAGRLLPEAAVTGLMHHQPMVDLRLLPCSGPATALVARKITQLHRLSTDRRHCAPYHC